MEYYRWKIAEQYGWTLNEVDSLSMDDLQEYFQVQDGAGKARKSIIRN